MLFHVRLACCWEAGIAKRGIHACCVVNVGHNFGVQGGAIGQYILLHREGRERREIRICGGLREWGEDDQYEDSLRCGGCIFQAETQATKATKANKGAFSNYLVAA